MATTTGERVHAAHVAGTTPYAWPWDGVLDASGTAVLIVEAPGSAGRGGAAAHNAEVVVAALRRAGGTAIRVVTRPGASGRLRSGSRSGAVRSDPDAIPSADDTVTAEGVDGFFGSALESRLRRGGVERLLLVGSWLETSVHSTMRTANDMGFECLLVVDACVPGDEALVAASVSMIEMSGGIFGAVGVTSRVVEAYAREGGQP